MIILESKLLPERIRERCQRHWDYYEETVGWFVHGAGNANIEKQLPYHDIDSLKSTQKLGARLFHESLTAKAIHENLLSYIVGTGHTYKVAPKVGKTFGETELKKCQDAIDAMLTFHEWPELQEEFYNRWFRTGETFQLHEPTRNFIDLRWIEPHNVNPPEQPSELEKAKFGIEYQNDNVRRPIAYYITSTSESNPRTRRTLAQTGKAGIMHCKRGVDRNDPRGIPLLWAAYCPCREIDEIDHALTQVALSIAENAVEYRYQSGVRRRTLEAIAGQIDDTKDERRLKGKTNNAGSVVHARDFQIELHGINLDARNWVEMISAKSRRISAIAGIPEFIITGDADTGSRNSLISAVGPLTRRMSREAAKGARCEMELLYMACSVALGRYGDEDWLRGFKDTVQITANIPRPDDQDPEANARRVIREMDASIQSPQGACAELGRSYEAVMTQIEEHRTRQGETSARVNWAVAYSPEELKSKMEIIKLAVGAGAKPEQALEACNLDPIEFEKLVQQPPAGAGTNGRPAPSKPQRAAQ